LILLGQLFQLVGDFLHAQLRQALKPQVEDRAGLRFAEVVGPVIVGRVGRIVDQLDEGQDLFRRPAAFHQLFARLRRIGGLADRADDLVHVRHSHGEAAEHMRPVAGLVELERRAPRDDLLPEIEEGGEEAPQRQLLGPPAVQRQHVAAEGGLHLREAEKLVQHHLGRRVALQLDHHAHADPVASSATPEIPSSFFSRTRSAIRSIIDALFTW
jgi:hypothetical protein